MKIRCISDWSSYGGVTKNKIYTINSEDDTHYFIEDDRGIETGYYKDRFEIVREYEDIKELTLKEVFNYEDGSFFKMRILDEEFDLELSQGDLSFISGIHKDTYISEVFTLKMLIEAKFYLLESWREIDYFTAYTYKKANMNIKYINGDEEIIGTHYGILSNLDSRCRNTGEDLVALLSDAKWYVKVV